MHASFQRYLDAASGLTSLTAAKAEQVIKQLVRSGEAAGDQASELVDDLLERSRANRASLTSFVRAEVERAVKAAGVASAADLERLQKQVADLRRELVALGGGGGVPMAAPVKKATAKKTPAKKATAKKAPAKKTPAKKATAKKSAAKKATGPATSSGSDA